MKTGYQRQNHHDSNDEDDEDDDNSKNQEYLKALINEQWAFLLYDISSPL